MKKKNKTLVWVGIIILILIFGIIVGTCVFNKNKNLMTVAWDFRDVLINAESCNQELILVLDIAEVKTSLSNPNLKIYVEDLSKAYCYYSEGNNRCECQIKGKV